MDKDAEVWIKFSDVLDILDDLQNRFDDPIKLCQVGDLAIDALAACETREFNEAKNG